MINIMFHNYIKKYGIVYLIILIFLYSQLLLADKMFPIDLLISSTMMFCVTIHNVFLFQLISRVNIFVSIQNTIILRIGKKKYIEQMIMMAIIDVILNIIIIYGIPYLVFMDRICNLYLYTQLVIILTVLFLIYEVFIHSRIVIENSIFKFVFYAIPFFINLIVHINYLQLLYGGII